MNFFQIDDKTFIDTVHVRHLYVYTVLSFSVYTLSLG